MNANLPVITEAYDDDWVSTCGVCGADFAIRRTDAGEMPYPHGSFCPDCRERGLKAPGVLNWSTRDGGHAS